MVPVQELVFYGVKPDEGASMGEGAPPFTAHTPTIFAGVRGRAMAHITLRPTYLHRGRTPGPEGLPPEDAFERCRDHRRSEPL